MKKFLHIIVLLIFGLKLSTAQDIIYTISGEVDSKKVALDSILVENLTNKTWISFNNLPQHDIYQINLTKKAFWGTVGNNLIGYDNQFSVIQNQPGIIEVAFINDKPETVDITLYNINGQKLFSDFGRIIYPGNSIRVQPGQSGVFILRVESQRSAQNFKLIGSSYRYGDVFEIVASNWHKPVTKNALIYNDFNFSFSPGDNIRVSVFKTNHFAEPVSKTLTQAESVSFKLKSINDSISIVTRGKLNFIDITNFDLSKLTSETISGSYPVLSNGSFNALNEISDSEISPLLFFKDSVFQFGYFPNSDSENSVSTDDLILFFYKMFPDIGFLQLSDQEILNHIHSYKDYDALKTVLLESIQQGLSPLENSEFIELLKENVKVIILHSFLRLKSASFDNKVEEFQFNFDRKGKVEWPAKLPIFSYIGVEIKDKNTGAIVMPVSYINTMQLVLTPSSLYRWLYENAFKIAFNLPDVNTFNFEADGSYIISYTNGNSANINKQGISDKFNNEVRLRNARQMVMLSVYLAANINPILKKRVEQVKCAFELIEYIWKKEDEIIELIKSNQFTFHQLKKLNDEIIGSIPDILNKCAPAIEIEWGFSEKLKKIIGVLSLAEDVSMLGFTFKDFILSPIAGTEIRHFYDDVSFSKLEYSNETDTEIHDSYKSEVEFKGMTLKESNNLISIYKDFNYNSILTRFESSEKMIEANDLNFKATVTKGSAKITGNENVFAHGGYFFLDMEMGWDESEVVIEPTFSNSEIEPITIKLIPLAVASLHQTGGNDQFGVVNNELFTALSVQVKDEKGNPVRNAEVSFEPACEQCGELRDLNAATNNQEIAKSASMSNNRAASPVLVKTDEQGVASAVWTLGTKNGEQKVIAKISGNTEIPEISFIAQAQGEPASIVLVSRQTQTGTPGQYLSEDLKVRVTDKDGNVLKGITVVFQVDCQDCGVVDLPIVVTDSEGYASTRWKIGNSEEDQLVMVTLPGYKNVPAVFFKATQSKGHPIYGKWTAFEYEGYETGIKHKVIGKEWPDNHGKWYYCEKIDKEILYRSELNITNEYFFFLHYEEQIYYEYDYKYYSEKMMEFYDPWYNFKSKEWERVHCNYMILESISEPEIEDVTYKMEIVSLTQNTISLIVKSVLIMDIEYENDDVGLRIDLKYHFLNDNTIELLIFDDDENDYFVVGKYLRNNN